MTEKQKEIVLKELIMLDMKDIMELTGWCENVVRKMFAYDKDFPAIKKGKKYQVELNSLCNIIFLVFGILGILGLFINFV